MSDQFLQAARAADFLRGQSIEAPVVGILTGTGLGESLDRIQVQTKIGYDRIPHFPLSTVTGHAGQLLAGRLAGKPVVAMQGRVHLYEGYSPRQVVFPIRVMQQLGVRQLVVTNAAGGLNPQFIAGQMMIVADHINLTGENPLAGPNEDRWGVRFPDMAEAYSRSQMQTAAAAADAAGIAHCFGVYAGLKGPSLETPAEVRFLKTIGADAVGFSTVMEVIAAVHAGMSVLGMSIITNVHDPQNPQPSTVDEIVACAQQAAPQLGALIEAAAAAG